jgi:hypothetical protein
LNDDEMNGTEINVKSSRINNIGAMDKPFAEIP